MAAINFGSSSLVCWNAYAIWWKPGWNWSADFRHGIKIDIFKNVERANKQKLDVSLCVYVRIPQMLSVNGSGLRCHWIFISLGIWSLYANYKNIFVPGAKRNRNRARSYNFSCRVWIWRCFYSFFYFQTILVMPFLSHPN